MNLSYAEYVYDILVEDTVGLDSIYEDYIIKRVGELGLEALKQHGLIESCGVINCRRLYTLIKPVAKKA